MNDLQKKTIERKLMDKRNAAEKHSSEYYSFDTGDLLFLEWRGQWEPHWFTPIQINTKTK
jgi:hypothetical protein